MEPLGWIGPSVLACAGHAGGELGPEGFQPPRATYSYVRPRLVTKKPSFVAKEGLEAIKKIIISRTAGAIEMVARAKSMPIKWQT